MMMWMIMKAEKFCRIIFTVMLIILTLMDELKIIHISCIPSNLHLLPPP